MTQQLVTKGKATWVGSGAPNRSRVEPRRLKVRNGGALAFDKHPTPVPYGDEVGEATLRFWVAADFTGTVTLTCRRVADRPDWGDLTWNNKPGVTGTHQPTVTLTNPTKGTLVEFNVAPHLSTVANAGGKNPHYGWRIESDNATALYLWGFDSDSPPELYVEYSNQPDTPTDLTSGVVADPLPVLSFTAPDITGEDDIDALRVQIDPASDEVTPDFDSGWVTDVDGPELDLSTTAYPGVPGTGTFWRVQWKNSSGVASDWSDWHDLSYLARPVITITNPPVGGTVADVTPTFLAQSSAPITHYRFKVVDPTDPSRVFKTSKKKPTASTTFQWAPVKPLQERPYRLLVDVWDTEDRVVTAGEPLRTRETRDFTITDGTAATPTGVTATQQGTSPVVEIAWTSAATPDSFTLYDNGEVIAAGIEPAEALVSGTSYAYRWAGSTPQVAHSYRVRAVVNDDQSPKSAAAVLPALQVDGIWVIDTTLDAKFIVGGNDVRNWRRTDQVGTYQVLGGGEIYVFAGDNGVSGSVSGPMRARPQSGITLEELDADLAAIEENKGAPVRLVLGDTSLLVVLKDLSSTPHPDHNSGAPRRLVQFDFIEYQGDD